MSNGQMLNLTGGLPPEILGQQQQLNRQQQMAQALMQQGMQQPQGQMVSGRYVAPSFFQNVLPLAQMYVGKGMAEQGDKKALDLAAALRKQYADEIKEFRTRLQGVEGAPERTTELAGPFGEGVGQNNVDIPMPTAYMPAKAAVAPDPQGAYDYAAGAYNPALQAIGLKNLVPEEITMAEGATRLVRNPDGTYRTVATSPSKNPEKIQTAAIVLGLDSKPRDQWTAQDRAMIDAQIQKTAQSGAMNLGQKGFDNTLKLRSDFRSEPVYKDFQAIDGAYRQINKSLDAGTAAGDLAASTKLMKLLDPTSVVRESELAMAMQATGKLDQLYNYANKIATGQFLSPKQKGEFRTLATEFYNSAGEQYNIKRGEYADIAKRNDINVPDVVGAEVKLKPQIIKTPDGKNKPASAEKIPPAPQGFDQKLWNVMTPQERALF
jgi:hypothetical protein